jgi:peptidyl-prolyl cis-trans isomerase SurA
MAAPSLAATVVTVNGTPITDTQVDQRLRLFSMEGNKTGRKGATDQLIDEALQMEEAKRLGITVSNAQVDEGLQQVSRNIKISQDKLIQMLQQNGVGIETLRDRLRAAIAWNAVSEQAIMPQVQISDLELDQKAASQVAAFQTYDYILKEIIFVAPGGQGAGGRTAQANRYRSSFAGCDSAVQLSLSYTDAAVIDVGRRHATRHHQAARGRYWRVHAGGLPEDPGGRPDLYQGQSRSRGRYQRPAAADDQLPGRPAQPRQDHLQLSHCPETGSGRPTGA